MSTAAIAILAMAGAIVAGVLLFLLIGFVLSVVSGWQELARRYRATAPPRGTRFGAVTGRVGPVNYNSSLTIYVSSEGLYLTILKLFRLSHPDLFIPWGAVTGRQAARTLFFDAVDLAIGQPYLATIMLPKRVLADAHA